MERSTYLYIQLTETLFDTMSAHLRYVHELLADGRTWNAQIHWIGRAARLLHDGPGGYRTGSTIRSGS